MARGIAALAAGVLFGFGLTLSQMVNPAKVLGFLDIAGDWDPSLALVMGGAATVSIISFRLILRRKTPLLAGVFRLPGRREIDARLIGGSALFGIGWGLVGFCPGPAVAALAFVPGEVAAFVGAMVAGSLLAGLVPASRRSQGDASPHP